MNAPTTIKFRRPRAGLYRATLRDAHGQEWHATVEDKEWGYGDCGWAWVLDSPSGRSDHSDYPRDTKRETVESLLIHIADLGLGG